MQDKLKLEQPNWVRFLHWFLVINVLTKIFTGLYISYPSRLASFRLVREIHIYLAYPLLFWLIARVYFALVTRDYLNFVPTIKDLKNIPRFLKYETYFTRAKPAQGKYNVGQKLVFLSWGIILSLLIITGFSMYDPTLSGPVDYLMGGYNYIRWYHFLATLYLVGTVSLHIYLVFITDLSRMKAMFTGYILKKP